MRETILTILSDIENQYDVQIIYACEAGSRTWGISHENSDYDIRFIFVYPLQKYLVIDAQKDVIEVKRIPNIELSGWELGKALQLLRKQNPSLLEWLHSHIIYEDRLAVKEQLLTLHQRFYFKKPLLHHYFNMAKRNASLLEHKYSFKLQVNIIRPLLMCQWILKNDYFPPLQMGKVVSCIDDPEVMKGINNIISLKKTGDINEGIHRFGDSNVMNWTLSSLSELEVYLNHHSETAAFSNMSFTEELNKLFQDVVLGLVQKLDD
jgi:predicted nucleotidyltransferase